MVYTLTFCPSLEYSASLDEITVGADNAVSNGDLHVAGSGVIIAKILKQLDVKSTVLGFAAGFTGGEIEEILRKRGLDTDIVYLEKGLSPFNVVLSHTTEKRRPTRFASPLLSITYNDLLALFGRLEKLDDGDVLVLSGEVPEGIPADIYAHIPDAFRDKDVRVVLDVPAEPLAKCLQFQPFLVVTSREKLAETFGELPQTEEKMIDLAYQLHELGAQNVLVAPDSDNTVILIDSSKNILKQNCADTTFDETAFNALTAGFIAGSEDKDVDNDYAIMLAASAASASAAERGIPSKPKIINVMKDMLKSFS